MSNKKNNTRRPAARPDARRPDARPSKGERRREAQHRREMAAFQAVAPYLERALERTLDFWASEAGERAAQRFETLVERAVASAPAQRAISALLGYAERGLEAEASEAEARSKRARAEEGVALERVLAEAVRAEELEQIRHRVAVAHLEREARAAEARLAEPAPEPAPLAHEGVTPALMDAMNLSALLHEERAEAQAEVGRLHEEVGRLEAQLRAQAEDAPPMPEPQAQAEADSATADSSAEPEGWAQRWREHEERVLAKLEELRRNC